MRLLPNRRRAASTATRRASERGMTLIEILVVVLIIGMILGMVGTNVFGIFGEAKDKLAENEIRNITKAINLYRETRGRLPEDLAEVRDLLENVEEDGTILDPWERPYEYERNQTSEDGFVVISMGADENDQDDDIRSDQLGKKRD